jgi:hypothetical protein
VLALVLGLGRHRAGGAAWPASWSTPAGAAPPPRPSSPASWARVASAHLDEKFGEVRVGDERGNEIMVHARLGAGEPPLTRGARVVLVDYTRTLDLFWATASPAEAQAST